LHLPYDELMAENPKYTLTYFNKRGRAEPSRLLFHAAGVKFTDRRVVDEWKDIKPTLPWGQLPVLEIESKDGKKVTLHQSLAIHRFVANQFGFMGTTPVEAAEIDALCEDVTDVYRNLLAIRATDEQRKEKIAKYFTDEFFGEWMSKFTRALKANEDGKSWLVGKKISLADVVFFTLIDNVKARLGAESFKALPEIDAHHHRVATHKGIAEWIKTRPDEKF